MPPEGSVEFNLQAVLFFLLVLEVSEVLPIGRGCLLFLAAEYRHLSLDVPLEHMT